MCLLVFYINPKASSNELYLVLVNVRDEAFDRPTKLAEIWEKHPHVIGGMDLEPGKEGGTWLAISEKGKIGILLNILQPEEEISPGKKGRGFLAADYVTGDAECFDYLDRLRAEGGDYNEFLLVAMDLSCLEVPQVAHYTNSSAAPPVRIAEPGVFAFGNSVSVNSPWPKVAKAKENFTAVIQKHGSTANKDALVQDLFRLLMDSTKCSVDESMKKQGKNKSLDFLKRLSAIFVNIPESNYGSRCHTVILIDGSGNVDYFERSRPEGGSSSDGAEWLCGRHSFKLQQQARRGR